VVGGSVGVVVIFGSNVLKEAPLDEILEALLADLRCAVAAQQGSFSG
jgi:hypothetical protein